MQELTICSGVGGDEYCPRSAVLRLTRERAARYLALRAAWEAAGAAAGGDVHGVELFNYDVEWSANYVEVPYGVDEAEPAESRYLGWGVWDEVRYGDPQEPEFSADCDTLRVVRGGVMWTAQLKHARGQWETDLLPWAMLEAFLAGGNPFRTAVVDKEEVDADEEEEDGGEDS